MFTNPTQEEGYSFVDFSEDSLMVSEQFKQLSLSVKELLNPPVVEQLIKEEQEKIKSLEQVAETQRQRAEKLAQRLREMGVNPDEVN